MTNQEIGVACTQTHMLSLSVCLVNRLHFHRMGNEREVSESCVLCVPVARRPDAYGDGRHHSRHPPQHQSVVRCLAERERERGESFVACQLPSEALLSLLVSGLISQRGMLTTACGMLDVRLHGRQSSHVLCPFLPLAPQQLVDELMMTTMMTTTTTTTVNLCALPSRCLCLLKYMKRKTNTVWAVIAKTLTGTVICHWERKRGRKEQLAHN